MMTHPLTVELPEPIFQQLSRLAQLTQQPLELLVLQSITGNLPPLPDRSPAALQPELLKMQTLGEQELLTIAHSQILESLQQNHLDLLEKNSAGTLTTQEQEELHQLGIQADTLMLRKAYAWALLRWHGHPVPALGEVPLL
jgi:hypothetical protein